MPAPGPRPWTGSSRGSPRPERRRSTDDDPDPEGAECRAFERQHTAALAAQALEQIAEIDPAIGRLDEGTYGICVRCGQPVGQGGWRHVPAAATCIRCAQHK